LSTTDVSQSDSPALDDLRSAVCSDGAPSARNLLVTVFGDALLPHGEGTRISVRALSRLLAAFGVNERLVRTSLTRLVNDGLLTTANEGRRSFYGVAPGALDLFRQADHRIYHGTAEDWDGSWTIVVIDGGEATARRRARLRQELAWAGLGSVAPNVMASPIVSAEDAARVVGHVGGFANVLVSRSSVVESEGTLGADELAHRVAALEEIGDRYARFIERYEAYPSGGLAGLAPELAFKLRTLLVAEFRRIALSDPQLPAPLLPPDWIGTRARRLAGAIYDAVATSSDAFLTATVDPKLSSYATTLSRFAVGPV
jgi:phenylacetic acid degradation operon negative regulatory protein